MRTCSYALSRRSTSRRHDRRVHDEAPRRRAALPGRADGAEQDRAHREIEVRVLRDDDGVVAAEFEDGAAEAARDDFGHCRPTRVDPVNEMSGKRRSCSIASPIGRPGPIASVKTPRHAVVGHHAIRDVLHGDGAERRRLGRLPDHRIAAHRGDGAHSTTRPRRES